MRRKVWLDCDPGHDDALAILLACTAPQLELLGVSTVACNQTVEKTTQNALAVLHAAGHGNVPVYQGQAKPLLRALPTCPEIHGATGLDARGGGRIFPDSVHAAQPQLAVLAMGAAAASHVAEHSAPLHIVSTGALTNVALMLTLYPAAVTQICVTLMGGALGIGNTGPVQEFNIQTDPEAAKIVFESGVELTMIPIEVTHSVLATQSVLARIERLGSPFGGCVVELLRYFAATYRAVFKFEHPPVHDPVAVAFVIDPSLFEVELMRVDVEVASALCAGQTVCDVWHQSDRRKNVHVARSVDVERCWELILLAIEAADRTSPLNGN